MSDPMLPTVQVPVLIPIPTFIGRYGVSPTRDSAWLLLGVGSLGAFGQVAMTRAYGKGSTLVAAALSYSGIVFASVIGIVVFGDHPPLVAAGATAPADDRWSAYHLDRSSPCPARC